MPRKRFGYAESRSVMLRIVQFSWESFSYAEEAARLCLSIIPEKASKVEPRPADQSVRARTSSSIQCALPLLCGLPKKE